MSTRPVFPKLFLLITALPCMLRAQTTVTLTTSPNPSLFGALVVLSATVSPSAATGKVTFYDGVTVLGTKPLVSGAAQISTIALPAGSRTLRAEYTDTGGNATVTSNVITQIVQAQSSYGFTPDSPAAVATVLKITAGASQATLLGTAFPQVLQVQLGDFGVPGAAITFTAPSNGASAVFSSGTVFTDAFGLASVTATANHIPGAYTVTAQSGNLTATFSLTNLQPATVTLASSANPATFGAPLALTATVTNATATGRVTFFDGVNILSAKPLSSGVASLSTTLLSAGSHKLTAYYRDDVNFVAGTSNTLTQTVRSAASVAFDALPSIHLPGLPASVVVADFNGDGKADFAASFLDTGSWWQVDLGASAPIGSIVIWNRTDCCGNRLSDYWVFVSNTPFDPADTPDTLQNRPGTFSSNQTTAPNPSATIPANSAQGRYVRVQLPGAGYLSLAEVQVFGTGAQSGTNLALGKPSAQSSTYLGYAVAVAGSAVDGNTDGNFFHSSVTSTGLYAVNIALGRGDGTFQAPVSYSVSYALMASGDFNGDGNTDLAFYDGSNVSVLLGNGDGTFRPAVTYFANTPVTPEFPGTTVQPGIGGGIAIGDFNGDGKADIVSGYLSYCCGPLMGNWFFPATLLPGNGDGTFGSPVSYHGVPPPYGMADLNGDGRPDLVGGGFVGGGFNQGLGPVVLGSGDGTGTPVGDTRQFGSTVFPGPGSPMLTGDFNGDGKADLVTGSSVFLGKGDGTFLAPLTFSGIAAATGDFNGDGILDLVIADSYSHTLGILLGNGDGTFPQGITVIADAPLAVADFNGDGRADILTASPGGVTLLLGAASGGTASLTATGGTPQSAAVGTAFPNPLEVTVKDGSGNPVSGIDITFAVPTVGPSALLSGASRTNSAGVASVTAIANNIPGSYSVTASLGSLSTSFSLANVSRGGSNLAQGKAATQSSTLAGATGASAAVDGNTDGNFFDGSVTATNLDPNPWWQVDLGASATVSSIVIWNRTDCCASRLSDYWVFVSDTPFLATDTPATLQNRPGTFAIHQTTSPNPSVTITAAAQGRYVRVQLSGANYLSLAEVQMFGTGGGPSPSNLSQGKLASQSSTLAGTTGASLAVDGNTDGNFFDGSVTATNPDPNAWWQVDLGAAATVSSIVIFNRTDCCGSRLGDYWVFVSNTPFLTTDTPATLQNRAGTFAIHQTSAPNPSVTIPTVVHPCPPGALCPDFLVQGRYVRVQLSGTDYLSLAEVQVFGTGGAPAPTNVAQGKAATQSSTLPGYATAGPSSAVDNNTDGNFFDGSVTHTNLESNPWWQVDLGASTAVGSIVIYNRTDCCGTRLGDYWVFVSDTPFLATDTPATLQNRAGTFASHQTTAPNPSTTITAGAQGRYVRVQLSSSNYLSLAEVQVFGQ